MPPLNEQGKSLNQRGDKFTHPLNKRGYLDGRNTVEKYMNFINQGNVNLTPKCFQW